jgi:CIC family chloride channel protein
MDEQALIDKLARWTVDRLARWKVNERVFMSVVAVVIGVLTGYGVVLFRYTIRAFQVLFYHNSSDFLQIAPHISSLHKILIPALGGALVGPIIYFLAREAKGHAVPEVMEAMAVRGGRIRPRVTGVQIVASAISIGCGGSVGREGPIVQIGAAVGSTVAQIFRLPKDRMRTLAGCGAAAGIAATFNAPIAGVFFALEVLLGEFGVRTFSPLVLSTVTATVISRHHFGDVPTFTLPGYSTMSGWEFFLYGAMGIFLGLIALSFVIILYKSEDLFDDMPIPEYVKPIIGGLAMGGIIIYLPHTFGVGYGAINHSVTGSIAAEMLLILIIGKIFATSITLGAGMSGGIFAPSLFIGAMAGGLFGTVVNQIFPEITAPSGAYALVGMGGVFAAATHAPITAILIIFELTSEYTIILPLMITCITATLLTTYLKRGNIYTLKLMRRGIFLSQGREQSILQNILVESVMKPEKLVIQENTVLSDIIAAFQENNASYLQVVNMNDELSGIISFRDIRQMLAEESLANLVIAKDVATNPVITVTPKENLEEALRKLGGTGVSQLPVVDHDNPRKVIGTLDNKDINAAYDRVALTMDAAAPP